MGKLFHDLPESLDNTSEIVDKVEILKLKRDILLPNFVIPNEFKIHSESSHLIRIRLEPVEYLKHLTFKGAAERYHDLTAEIEERINFELFTVRNHGLCRLL